MPRRYTPEKRDVVPDLRYSSANVSMFVNRLMHSGKKSVATRLIYDALSSVEEKTGRPAMETFDQALKNVSPQVEVKPRRVGGATYQVPVPVETSRQVSLAMRWLLAAARNRSGRSMSEKLAAEFMDAAKNQGAAIKKKDDTHRMAEANRAFSHFRY
jgi:small subunit ribosomal protein S7